MKVIGNLTKDAIIRAVASEAVNVTQAVGTEVTMNSGSTTGFAAAFDSNAGKVVVAFSDGTDGQKGKAIVGTVNPSNNSISFGTEVVFQNSEITGDQMDCVFDSNSNKIVIFYTDTNNPSTNDRTGTAIVGTVSGTSISFGTKTAFESGNTQFITATFDSTNNKVAVFYRDADNSNYGTAAVGTVSGTGISFGSPVVFNSANTPFLGSSFDSNAGKIVVVYKDVGNSNYGNAIVGTVSGTSISFGSEATFLAANGGAYETIFDSSANKHVVVYDNPGDNNYGYARVGTVSGTSISFGTAAKFETGVAELMRGVYDTGAGKVVIVYKDGSNSNRPTFVSGTVSGTDITFDTPTVLKAVEGATILPGVAYDSTNKRVVASYIDTTGSDNGLAQVIRTGYSAASGGTIADGVPVVINANGTVSSISQSSFTENLGAQTAFPAPGNGSNNWAIQLGGTYDSKNGKVIITFNDYYNSQRGTALVGTVSGTSVTWGTAVVFETGRTQWTSVAYDSVNEKIVVSYQDRDNSFYGKSIVGTVSGNSVTFGTPVVFESAETTYTDTTYDTSSGAIVVNYNTSSGGGEVRAGSVSGTSITFGSTVQFGNTGAYGRAIYHPVEECVVIAYQQSSSAANARALTVSGTTITLGNQVTFQSGGQVNQIDIAYDSSSKKVVVVGRDEANNTYGSSWVGTVSGTTLSFVSPVTFQSGAIDWSGIQGWHTGGVALFYDTSVGGAQQILKFGTISGTTITWSSGTQIAASQMGYYRGFAMDTDNNALVVVYNHSSVPYYRVYNPDYNTSNLTSENFVGITDGAALDGTNSEILSSCNVARNQTGLTAGQTYFVTPTGTLSTTAGDPSVEAGTAISSTELIVKG